MYIDWTYIVYVLPAVLLALIAQINVTSTFNKYKKVLSARQYTGYDAARGILDANGLQHIAVERVKGELTDHYDPKNQCIRLSEAVYDSTSVGSIGVAAHEAGHAIQYAVGYSPMKFRSAIIPISNIGSSLSVPLVILGVILSTPFLAYFGVALFACVTLFQLLTLPVEFNASGRAMRILSESNVLSEEELKGSRKVLTAAALTYVAALAVSLGNLLRLLTIAGRSNNRKR